MKRTLFSDEHLMFQATCQRFVAGAVAPNIDAWEKAGIIPREVWQQAGELGFLGINVPEEFGGGGLADFRYNVILDEALLRAGATSLAVGLGLHNDVVIPYILNYGTDEQKRRWLPGMCQGAMIGAIAMTEPAAGSDLASIRTAALPQDEGYLLNGSKTFITNGILSDLVIVVAKTDPAAGHKGLSLLVVERGMTGFERGRKLEKIGLHSQDTAELFFTDVHVPGNYLLGKSGEGFYQLMQQLPQERLAIALMAAAASETALEMAVNYAKERTAFGQPIGQFQAERFKLAEMKTEVQIGRVFVDRCIEAHLAGELTAEEAAMGKWWLTELQKRVVDACLQIHGGYGYMLEYPIARLFLDARVQTIYGGTTEIMKEIIGRGMGF